ncbi:MAG: O-succinylbenzoate synthase [Actinomycetia bacterium]|nr:O-succinylbenzoate synthase [Actinomycetes bacterium]
MTTDFPNLKSFSLRLREEFRGLSTREGVLISGPAGWGEFSPFPNYTRAQDALWLQAALEAAFVEREFSTGANIRVNAIIGDIEDAYVASLRALTEFGCTTIKVKVGLEASADVARVSEIMRAFRDRERLADLKIRLDANGRWDVKQAIHTMSELEHAPIEYVEQPCRSISDLGDLRREIDVPIAVDETIRLSGELNIKEFADIAIVKVSPLGGIDAVEKIIEKLDVPVRFSGSLESSVGLGSSLWAANMFAPDQVAGLGTGMLLATDLVADPILPILGQISMERRDPEVQACEAASLTREKQALWAERVNRALELVPSRVLASWGVPHVSVKG